MSLNDLKLVHVAAAVIQEGNEVLCVQRPANKFPYISEKWEFPGGKLEQGETGEEALRREIFEELGLAVLVQPRLMTVDHSYPDFRLKMEVFTCTLEMGQNRADIMLNEHIHHLWLDVSSERFAELEWAAADLPIVRTLIDRRL